MENPKQKAIQLYNQFRDTSPVLELNLRSKNRAIILAKEVIKELQRLPKIPYNEKREEYWRSVKSELEKL